MAEVDSAPGAAGMMPPGAEDSTELLSAGGLTSGEEGTDEGSAAIKPKNLAEVLAAVKKQVRATAILVLPERGCRGCCCVQRAWVAQGLSGCTPAGMDAGLISVFCQRTMAMALLLPVDCAG